MKNKWNPMIVDLVELETVSLELERRCLKSCIIMMKNL